MKRNYYDVLEGQAVELSSKIEALAYLLNNYNRHSQDEKPYPLTGLSLVMEDLAQAASEISERLCERPPLDTNIETNK